MSRAFVLDRAGSAIRRVEREVPVAGPGQVVVRVEACAVCRTDVHVADGEIARTRWPIVPGHQVVGRTEGGDRVGLAWLAFACGTCRECRRGLENLCPSARFTGCDVDGGYADHVVAEAGFCLAVPAAIDSMAATPFLCAGAIGWRALRAAGDVERLGLYGFGAAARILTQVAVRQGRRVFAFGRPGARETQRLALELGATWAGGSDEAPPEPLDGAILFAPAGELVPVALASIGPGGVVVCAEIHMSDVPSFPYARLWGERVLRSVANVTRRDVEEMLAFAADHPIVTPITPMPLERAEEALEAVSRGDLRAQPVLVP